MKHWQHNRFAQVAVMFIILSILALGSMSAFGENENAEVPTDTEVQSGSEKMPFWDRIGAALDVAKGDDENVMTKRFEELRDKEAELSEREAELERTALELSSDTGSFHNLMSTLDQCLDQASARLDSINPVSMEEQNDG